MKYEYIKEASPFGSLRQIPEMKKPKYVCYYPECLCPYCNEARAYEEHLRKLPAISLSVQPSEEWMQRKEYEEDRDFKKGYFVKTDSYQGEGGGYFHTYEEAEKKYFEWSKYDGQLQSFAYPPKEVAIPIEKKGDDLLASQNHPQPESSVATLACTEGNSIEQEADEHDKELFWFQYDETLLAYPQKMFDEFGLELNLTCGAFPEQYEVCILGTEKQVGYLRLRHGKFRVDYPDCGGETIYEGEPQGDGLFEKEERMFYLTGALKAIVKKVMTEHLSNSQQEVKERDTTGDHSSKSAGSKKPPGK